MRASPNVRRSPDDWRMDAQAAVSHQQATATLSTAWTARFADGTVCDVAAEVAQSARDKHHAFLVGPATIYWLQTGECRRDVLEGEAARIAEEQGESKYVVLLALAALNSVTLDNERDVMELAKEALLGAEKQASEARRRHRRVLRRHASELRRAHGLGANGLISALAVPRHSRRPPLNAKHWGPRQMGAAICGGFKRDAIRLAGAYWVRPSEPLEPTAPIYQKVQLADPLEFWEEELANG